MFLPPNVTAICQPMDQGVLEALKRNYRRKLLSTLIEEMEEGKDLIQKLKNVNVKDAVYWIAGAWADVKTPTIAKSWKKLLGGGDDQSVKPDNVTKETVLPLVQRLPGCEDVSVVEVETWLNDDDEQFEITDEEIVTLVNCDEDESEDSDEAPHEPQRISHNDGVRAFETALQYAEQQEATGIDILMLQRWRDLAAKKRQSSGKQTTINNFFKPA